MFGLMLVEKGKKNTRFKKHIQNIFRQSERLMQLNLAEKTVYFSNFRKNYSISVRLSFYLTPRAPIMAGEYIKTILWNWYRLGNRKTVLSHIITNLWGNAISRPETPASLRLLPATCKRVPWVEYTWLVCPPCLFLADRLYIPLWLLCFSLPYPHNVPCTGTPYFCMQISYSSALGISLSYSFPLSST